MFKINKRITDSFSYIFVSGASKGFNYILLLYFAVGIYSQQYVSILLLLSLEQILSLLLPLNQSSIIYSKSISNHQNITNKIITSSFLVVFVIILMFFLLKNVIYNYFDVHLIIVYISIFVSMLINSYMVYLTNYYKLIEEHKKALLIQGLLLITFISIIGSILFFKNIIVAFFLGKAIGLLIVLAIVIAFNLQKFQFKLDYLNWTEIKQILNLFSVSILGWLSGLGFMNLAKQYSNTNELAEIGYILNVFNVFLLFSVGVNSIYGPIIRNHLMQKALNKALIIKSRVLIIYLSVGILFFLAYLLFSEFNLDQKSKTIISIVPYVLLIYIFNAFNWVSQPFYLILNKFKDYNLVNIITYVVWAFLILICSFFEYQNYIWFLIAIHVFKGLFSYFYAKMNFMTRKYET